MNHMAISLCNLMVIMQIQKFYEWSWGGSGRETSHRHCCPTCLDLIETTLPVNDVWWDHMRFLMSPSPHHHDLYIKHMNGWKFQGKPERQAICTFNSDLAILPVRKWRIILWAQSSIATIVLAACPADPTHLFCVNSKTSRKGFCTEWKQTKLW